MRTFMKLLCSVLNFPKIVCPPQEHIYKKISMQHQRLWPHITRELNHHLSNTLNKNNFKINYYKGSFVRLLLFYWVASHCIDVAYIIHSPT